MLEDLDPKHAKTRETRTLRFVSRNEKTRGPRHPRPAGTCSRTVDNVSAADM